MSDHAAGPHPVPATPRVSVCIPASRPPAFLRATLASVLAQRFADFEVIVSDDAGDLARVVEESADPRVRYRRNERPLGFAANHLACLEQARGELLSFLHDDDRLHPEFLSTTVARFDADPDLAVVVTNCRFDEGDGRFTLPRSPVAPGRHDRFLPEVLRDGFLMYPSLSLLRRSVVEEAPRPWPELACGDMVVFIDAAERGRPFHFVDEPLVDYARHAGQISADEQRFRDDLVRLLERYAFADPLAEGRRRQRLERALLSRARGHAKAGRGAAAREDAGRVRRAGAPGARLEAALLGAVAGRPRLLRAVLAGWYRVRGVPAVTRSREVRGG